MTSRKSPTIRAFCLTCLGSGLIWCSSVTAIAGDTRLIDWRTDYRSARTEAQAKGRLLWVQFTASWCTYCHMMETESFAQPKIAGKARESFVAVKIQTDQNEDLTARFGVQGLPSTVIVTPAGQIVARHEGYTDARTFTAFLDSAIVRFGPRRIKPPADRPEEEVALAGYCPVSLIQQHVLVRGRDSVSVRFQGRMYQFADLGARNIFLEQPERFVPINAGRCPVTQVDKGEASQGSPHYGILYQGHLYVCIDETSRERFLNNPDRYSRVDLAERGFCPHCWGRDRVCTRGQSAYPLLASDTHLLLPVLGQIEAFRAGGDSVRR